MYCLYMVITRSETSPCRCTSPGKLNMSAKPTPSGPSQEAATPDTSSASSQVRSRGSHKPRGGLGKYLRARGRGRGRGGGRPAEFHKRLVLEDEEEVEFDPESEEYKELQSKYSRRQLGSNADRYAEAEPVLNSDGSNLLSFVDSVDVDAS